MSSEERPSWTAVPRSRRLEDFLRDYDSLTQEFRRFAGQVDTDRLIAQRDDLSRQLADLRIQVQQLTVSRDKAMAEANKYKASFYQLLLDEKYNLLHHSQRRLEELITRHQQQRVSSLDILRQHIQQQLAQVDGQIGAQSSAFYAQKRAELQAIAAQVAAEDARLRELSDAAAAQLRATNGSYHQAEASQPLSPELLRHEADRVKTESRFGLTVFNYIGILFIFAAVITLGVLAARYLNNMIPALAKGLALFLVPLGFFGLGEWLRRKDWKHFAFGLIGGAIGLYYIVVYINYFVMRVVDGPTAFGLVVAGAVLSIVGCYLYRNLAVGILAVIGGYLPIVSYWGIQGWSSGSLFAAQLYLLLLNAFVIFSYQKFKWHSFYLTSFLLFFPWPSIFMRTGLHNPYLDMVYGLLGLALYAILPLSRLRRDPHRSAADAPAAQAGSAAATSPVGSADRVTSLVLEGVWLAALLNFSFMILELSNMVDLNQWADKWGIGGLLALAFVLCLGSGWALQKTAAVEGGPLRPAAATALIAAALYLSGTLVVFLPFTVIGQVKYGLVSLALLTLFYGCLSSRSSLLPRSALRALEGLHYVAFYCLAVAADDLTLQTVVLALMAVHFFAHVWWKRLAAIGGKLELIVLPTVFYVHLNAFTAYLLWKLNSQWFGLNYGWLLMGVLLLLSFALSQWERFDRYYVPMGERGLIGLVVLVGNFWPLHGLANIILALTVNLLVIVLSLFDTHKLARRGLLRAEFLIIARTAVVLFSSSVLAYVNLDFAYLSIIVDVVYGLVALGFVMTGLHRGLALIRRIGLVFMLLVMAKLLLLDIPTVGLWQKFGVFLAFGLLALTVSYLYQSALKRQADRSAGPESGEQTGGPGGGRPAG